MGVNKTDKPTRATVARRRNAKQRREATVGDGGRRLELLLQPDAARALEKLQAAGEETATAVVSGLLLRAVSRKK